MQNSAARLSLLATAAAVLALVRLAMTESLLGVGPVSIGVQVAAVMLMIWARVTFGLRSFHAAATPTDGGLVTRGPYAIVRNPIYASAIGFTWAGVAGHMSPVNALHALVVTVGMLVRIALEERFLRQRYPQYGAYAARVKRLVPFVF